MSRVHAHEAAARAYAALGDRHKAARHRARAMELAGERKARGAGFGADRDLAEGWEPYRHLIRDYVASVPTDAQGWQQHGHLLGEPDTVQASRHGLTAVSGDAAGQEEFVRRQALELARMRARQASRDGPVRPRTSDTLQAFLDEPIRARKTRDERRTAHDADNEKTAKKRATESARNVKGTYDNEGFAISFSELLGDATHDDALASQRTRELRRRREPTVDSAEMFDDSDVDPHLLEIRRQLNDTRGAVWSVPANPSIRPLFAPRNSEYEWERAPRRNREREADEYQVDSLIDSILGNSSD
jgi:hypothetical protein